MGPWWARSQYQVGGVSCGMGTLGTWLLPADCRFSVCAACLGDEVPVPGSALDGGEQQLVLSRCLSRGTGDSPVVLWP